MKNLLLFCLLFAPAAVAHETGTPHTHHLEVVPFPFEWDTEQIEFDWEHEDLDLIYTV